MFELGDISAEQFFTDYWRKKPLFLKGGARLVLDREITVTELRMLCDRLERVRPTAVHRDNGCIFAHRVEEVSMELRSIAGGIENRLSSRHVSFDVAYASDAQGRGCRYDHSDTFVLQQSGSERWRLCSPDVLSVRELRQRMLDTPGAGLTHMPDECHEYLVEPGDLLYIPLFWGQWGVAEGGSSLSASLVVNADNALDLLLPALRGLLSEDRAWWYPLPQIPRGEEAPVPELIDQFFDTLLEAFARPSFRRRAKLAWWKAGYLGQVEERAKGADFTAPYTRKKRRARFEDLGLDPKAVERLREAEVSPPDPEASAAPGDRSASQLRLMLARRVLRELFDVALSSHAHFPGRADSIVEIARALCRADLSAVAPLVARPEMTSWLWRMSEAVEFQHVSYFEEIAHPAPRLFLPALLTLPGELRGQAFQVGRSDERGINLLAFGRRLESPVPLGTRMEVELIGPMLRFSSAAGRMVELPADAVSDHGRVDVGSGFFVDDLPQAHGGVTVLDRDAWVFGQYPRGRRFGARSLAAGSEASLRSHVDRHARVIEATWPELFAELSMTITLALPLSGRDGRAQTVPPFLGAVALTERAAAADLVEEMGRTKARLLTSVGLVFEGPVRASDRQRFEDAVAAVYRRAFEELTGVETSGRAGSFQGPLSPWGRAFLDALLTLMK